MSRVRGRLLVFALLSALGLSACSGDDKEANNTNNTNNVTPADMDKADQDTVSPDMAPDMKVEEDMGKEPEFPNGEDVEARAFAVMPPVPVSCDNPSGQYRIPFIISTDKVRPAVEGDRVGGRTLISNKTVNTRSILTRRPRIAQLQEAACESNADCGQGFVCASAGTPLAQRQCISQTGLELLPNTIRMDYDSGKGQKRQLVTLLMENSGSLVGFLPKDVGERFGEDGQKDLFENELRATDKDLKHRETAEQFIVQLASVADSATTRMSAWWFAGDNPIEGVRPLTNTENNSQEDYFTTDLSELMGKLGKNGMLPAPSNRLGTSNVYQAILRVVEKDLGLSKYAEHEKFLVVLVDGPNEVWDKDATKAKVLEQLNKHNVHLFVIHFDPRIEEDTMRDSLAYWAGSRQCRMDNTCSPAPTCLADADCGSHESCRPAMQYPDTAEGTVEPTAESYCLPRYESGRLGPVSEYADMACRTGGNYVYVSSVESLRPFLRALPSFFDGQWSSEAKISGLDKSLGAKDGFYRLSGTFVGVFGNASIGDQLSAPIPDKDNPALTSVDNRPIVRVGTPTGQP